MSRMLLSGPDVEVRRRGSRTPVTVVATVARPSEVTASRLRALPAGVTGLEVRADLVGDLDPDWLRRHFTGRLIYTLRSSQAGGAWADLTDVRRSRLRWAAGGYDVVDLEADRDLSRDVLSAVPVHRRRISWAGDPLALAALRERFDRMARHPAGSYLLAPEARSFDQALVPLQLLGQVRRLDVTAYATGSVGTWTRVLAPWLGAPVVSGRAGPAVAGTVTVDQLLSDYPFPDLPPLAALYGLVAPATNTTLFVRLLNTACRQLRLPGLYVPFSVPDLQNFRGGFWPGIAGGAFDRLGLPVRGLTLAAPYKETALTVADTVSPGARLAGAANLLVRGGDGWRAATTDGTAVRAALAENGFTATHRRVAVLGCGGAGRSTAVAFRAAGAQVTLVNRGLGRGRFAADLLGLPLVALREFDPTGYAAVVHATAARDEAAFDVDRLPSGTAVADFVCAAGPTALVRAALARGLCTVDGRAVLGQEAALHFRQMTGRPMPTGTRLAMTGGGRSPAQSR